MNSLTGLRVCEIGDDIATSYCGFVLASLGAEVVKVVREEARHIEQRATGADATNALMFRHLNRGKTIAVLDPTERADFDVLRALARSSRLVIEGSSRGQITLSPSELPDVPIVAVTPFGLDGPYSGYKSSDLTLFQLSGIGYGNPGQLDSLDRPPLGSRAEISQFVGGMIAVLAALSTLFRQTEIGSDSYVVDVSLHQAMALFSTHQFSWWSLRKVQPQRLKGVRLSRALVGSLKCLDGYFYLTVLNARQWEAWCIVMGEPDWVHSELFATEQSRAENWDGLAALMEEWAASKTKREITLMAQAAGVPVLPVNEPQDLLASEQLQSRGFFLEGSHPVTGASVPLPGPPFRTHQAAFPEGASRTLTELSSIVEALGLPAGLQRRHGRRGKSGMLSPGPVGLPLKGIRVIDLGAVMAAPLATRLLSMLGAEVIKVESRQHLDIYRTLAGSGEEPEDRPASSSPFFVGPNAGKRSITLNLKDPVGRELLLRLVAQSHVVAQNYALGVLERLNLGFEELRDANPAIVLLSLSGMGRTGPDREFVVYGHPIQAYVGEVFHSRYADTPPMGNDSVPVADIVAAICGASATVAALLRAQASGNGEHIDLSMAEANVSMFSLSLLQLVVSDPAVHLAGNDLGAEMVNDCFHCAGGDEWVAITVRNASEWDAVLTLVAPSLVDGEFGSWEYARQHPTEVRAIIETWTKHLSKFEAMRQLQAVSVAAGASLTAAEVINDPQLQHRRAFSDLAIAPGVAQTVMTSAWKQTNQDQGTIRSAPELGQDNSYVLGQLLGLSESDIQDFAARGMVR